MNFKYLEFSQKLQPILCQVTQCYYVHSHGHFHGRMEYCKTRKFSRDKFSLISPSNVFAQLIFSSLLDHIRLPPLVSQDLDYSSLTPSRNLKPVYLYYCPYFGASRYVFHKTLSGASFWHGYVSITFITSCNQHHTGYI